MKVHTLLWIIGLLFLCLVKEKKLNTMSQLIICMQVGPYNGRHGSVELVHVTMFINVRTINWSLHHLETCPTQGHNNAYGSSSPRFISWIMMVKRSAYCFSVPSPKGILSTTFLKSSFFPSCFIYIWLAITLLVLARLVRSSRKQLII